MPSNVLEADSDTLEIECLYIGEACQPFLPQVDTIMENGRLERDQLLVARMKDILNMVISKLNGRKGDTITRNEAYDFFQRHFNVKTVSEAFGKRLIIEDAEGGKRPISIEDLTLLICLHDLQSMNPDGKKLQKMIRAEIQAREKTKEEEKAGKNK